MSHPSDPDRSVPTAGKRVVGVEAAERTAQAGLGATLGSLLGALPGASVTPGADLALPLVGVRQDSRAVAPGELFVVLRGRSSDGAAFVPAAVRAGAVALLVERGRALDARGLPCVEVDDARLAMAQAAAHVYGDPTRALDVVGITGTNGKTTVAHLVAACLGAAGRRPGLIGTLGWRFEEHGAPGSHTSPEADELHRLAARMRALGATHLVMEVSSIALVAERVAGVGFAVAAFTNLTQDHLDYHGSMAAYAAAKDRLFLDFGPRAAVVNIDDPHGAELAARLAALGRPALTVSLGGAVASSAATVLAERVVATARGIELGLRTPAGPLMLGSALVGRHNAENLVVAFGCALALGVPAEVAARALGAVDPVPGRLERCDEPGRDDVVAVVDYAHTPDALERVLASLRPLCVGRLICVFGCGGDRDAGKREPMGEAVARGADIGIVTNDNPRSEAPERIAAAVEAGLVRGGARADASFAAEPGGGARYLVELDRARAIALAVERARPGDVVLVAGKGHEPYQVIGATVASFDDRVELRRALSLRRSASGEAS
ncbi:MAG: UDP-N-acetylmuramoyl-L-alanyl-D-glutamate--2,6-diaminopimelate ligase [Polyangiaceae bacterium]|nr:UDP-N-acetylmuramoyl-L-alanyl-D-glutamate--2,6-diaminopimelate ligase [Polyangiaceae bacterium]